MLEWNISSLPSRLGHWLLEKFDANTGRLNFFDKSIQVTPELINELIGLPLGTVDIDLHNMVKERGNAVYQEWKEQFTGSRIKHNEVTEKIEEQIKNADAGRMFQINFLVMFATILAKVVTTGTANLSVIPSLTSLENVGEMKWCNYVLDYLIEERKKWKGGLFCGPYWLLQVIYMVLLLIQINI